MTNGNRHTAILRRRSKMKPHFRQTSGRPYGGNARSSGCRSLQRVAGPAEEHNDSRSLYFPCSLQDFDSQHRFPITAGTGVFCVPDRVLILAGSMLYKHIG